MSYFREQMNIGLLTTEDLSQCQHHFVKMAGDDECAICDEGEVTTGVLQNKPGDDRHADVCLLGVSKVRVGGACSYGDRLSVADSGWAMVADSGTLTNGFVIHGCNSGLIATALINCVNAVGQLA